MSRPEDPTRCPASDHGAPDAVDMVTPTLPRKLKLSALVFLQPWELMALLDPRAPSEVPNLHWIEKDHGLHNPANTDARVKWVACFREVVALRCPRNAIGTPVVSDIDLLQASARERLIAFILWKSNHWKP